MNRTLAILAVTTGALTAICASAFAQESPVGAVELRGHRRGRLCPIIGGRGISVGSAGNERRVTHVATATSGTDAVNLTQLNAARGIAASAALPTATPSAAGKTAVGLGTGHHDGESAVGLAVAHAFTSSFQVSGGVARVSGGKNVARVAVGFEF